MWRALQKYRFGSFRGNTKKVKTQLDKYSPSLMVGSQSRIPNNLSDKEKRDESDSNLCKNH